jgi:hypothetical protein
VEEVGIAVSHTSGSSSWRGWAPHYLTHWASAGGGDGHRIIPHIGHQLVEGMGTVSFLQAGQSCSTRLRGLHCPDVVYRYQQLPVFLGAGAPALEGKLLSRVACGGKDTVSPHTSVIRLLRRWALLDPTHRAVARGGDGHRIIPHIGHQLVEEMSTPLSHTLGISSWRGWAPHYPTHRASARGGDGHRVLPHIGQDCPDPDGSYVMAGWLPPGSSPHDHKRVLLCIHPRSFAAGRGQSPWFAIPMGTGRERHLCVNMILFGQALVWCIGVQVYLFVNFFSLNVRCLHNCLHHHQQSFAAFSSFWGGHVPTPTPPSGFKRQASQAAGSWPGGRRMQMGVLYNQLGSSNHFVFSSQRKGQTTKCLLNNRSRWAFR